MATSDIEKIQKILGADADGIWGPKSQAALNREIKKTEDKGNPTLKKAQAVLGVDADGYWGPKSQAALNTELGNSTGFSATASSFADPADVVAFNKCKAQGKTDQQCFKVGDHGIAQFANTPPQDQRPLSTVTP